MNIFEVCFVFLYLAFHTIDILTIFVHLSEKKDQKEHGLEMRDNMAVSYVCLITGLIQHSKWRIYFDYA